VPYDANSSRTASLERGDGQAEMVFVPRGRETAISHLYQHDPCRVLFPSQDPGDPTLAVLLTTSGGLTGGDRLRVTLAAKDNTAATVTSQSAEKIYRSLGNDCRIEVAIEVGKAWLEWLPQETILFDRSRLRRMTAVDVAPEGRFLGTEMLVFGRHAKGEKFAEGFVHDAWRVSRGGRLVWTDALRLDGDIAGTLARPHGFDGAGALANAVYVADDAADHLDAARELLEGTSGRAGVTIVNGVMVARFIDCDAAVVRRDLSNYLADLRHVTARWPRRLPRVWYN
jgi:urease accessory protein